MRIGQLAAEIGVSADTVRFYERAGWLPSPSRRDNSYRDYSAADVDHLRLLIDLRRLDVPLEVAARIASWCHSGHCNETVTELPTVIAKQRAEINERIQRLKELDDRLADLETHLRKRRRALPMLAEGVPCCDAAAAVFESTDSGCSCCAVRAD
jgi:DNA-binding transcriptional MerR regulator